MIGMAMTAIPGTCLRTSRLWFGTDRLHNLGIGRAREDLLEAAVEAGFTHFDTAPLYGFGRTECDLAPVLARHRALTVTTKFGLHAPGGDRQPIGMVLARKAAGKLVTRIAAPRRAFDVDSAERALAGSLRRLGRERIDCYMLHEPTLAEVDGERLGRWLEDRRAEGLIRHFGIAAASDRIVPFVTRLPELAPLIQTSDSLDMLEADKVSRVGCEPQVTYGYVSAARARADRRTVPEILSAALARNARGAVIVSTSRRDRMAQYPAIAAA